MVGMKRRVVYYIQHMVLLDRCVPIFSDTLDNFYIQGSFWMFEEDFHVMMSYHLLLHVMFTLIGSSGACLIDNLGGQMLKNQIQKVEFPNGIKQVSRK